MDFVMNTNRVVNHLHNNRPGETDELGSYL